MLRNHLLKVLPVALLGAALMAPAAFGQSFNDPTGEAPIGILSNPDAKGPKLQGTLLVEFLNADETSADGLRVVIRLRRGPDLRAFFGSAEGPINVEEPAQTQAAIFGSLENRVLAAFFPDECGPDGLACVNTELVLKSVEEFALTDDGVNRFVFADVVIAVTSLNP